ncbi:PRC-barrel domain-containing protein [Streptomyces sp. NPDC050147]|uniref:PRC-barrel domain-containing protein n=1 Tax=Streptomyces sp. NPDC050147 TaxID=3155513 RepID=UPI00343BB8D2
MRLADLMGARVIDVSGRDIGHVSDVRLVEEKDPAATDSYGRLSVQGLVIATHHGVRLLACDRGPVSGPRTLAWLVRRAAAKSMYAPWDHVTAYEPSTTTGEPGTVRLTTRADRLTALPDAQERWNT